MAFIRWFGWFLSTVVMVVVTFAWELISLGIQVGFQLLSRHFLEPFVRSDDPYSDISLSSFMYGMDLCPKVRTMASFCPI